MSAVSAENFDSIYHQKGIITAFKEAGFKTAFFSNQRYNNSFIDFFGKEADHYDFIKEDSLTAGQNLSDDYLLALVQEELCERKPQTVYRVAHLRVTLQLSGTLSCRSCLFSNPTVLPMPNLSIGII